MKAEIIAEIKEKKEALDAQLVAVKLLPEELPEGWWPYADTFHKGFWIQAPWGSLDVYKTFRRSIGRDWKFMRSDSYDDGDRHIEYRNGDIRLMVCIKPPKKDSSTCQLIKVGEKIKPIYEVICS